MNEECVICGQPGYGVDSLDRVICEECANISKERMDKMASFFATQYWKTLLSGTINVPVGNGTVPIPYNPNPVWISPNTVWQPNTGTSTITWTSNSINMTPTYGTINTWQAPKQKT